MTVDGYALGRMWAEQRRADDNARISREWQAYARKLEANVAEMRRELELLRQEQAIAKRKRAVIVDHAEQHQLRATVLTVVLDKVAAALEKTSPGHPLASAATRQMMIDGAMKAVQQDKMLR